MTQYSFKYPKAGMVTYGSCLLVFYIANVLCLDSSVFGNIYYGPYDLFIESMTECKGKRLTKLVKMEGGVIIDPKIGQADVYGNSTILKSGFVVGARTRTFKWIGKRFEKLIDIHSDNLCEYGHLKYALDYIILVNQQCKMVKGFMTFSKVDINNITRSIFTKSSAIVGRLKSRVILHISSGDFLCFDLIYNVIPTKV